MKIGERLWRWCCSLKLAIVLASAATLVVMGGSVLMPARPRLFGSMDRLPLADWWQSFGAPSLGLTWWLPLAGLLLLLFGINTVCCFLDWLLNLSSRWRKAGEYLIHLGFVLLLIGYGWGSVAGRRAEGVEVPVGQAVPVPGMTGHYLRLEKLEPVFANGRPIDFRGDLLLLRGDSVVARQAVRTNHPLLHGPLVAILSSAEQKAVGFQVMTADQNLYHLQAGSRIELADGTALQVRTIYPHTGRLPGGEVIPLGSAPARPAFLLELTLPGAEPWRGWYLPTEPPPPQLAGTGLAFQPVEPLWQSVGLLTVNRDPGAPMAAIGGLLMLTGVLFALLSFYAKRNRGDRPEIT